MKCPRCQQNHPSHALFCMKCGTPFGGPDEPTRPAPSYADVQRSLAEALARETASGEILGVISRSATDVQPVFETIARSAMRLCDANFCNVVRYDGELLHLAAHAHVTTEAVEAMGRIYPMRPSRATVVGRAILERAVVHLPDVQADAEYDQPLGAAFRGRSALAVPMLRDGHPVGSIGVGRFEARGFTQAQINLLRTFADQAVIAIENARLFNETKEALEQQTATADILRLIGTSPTDAQPVFDAIAQSAMQLCEGLNTYVFVFDGDQYRLVAFQNMSPEALTGC
jgi:two-component system, NtrC family, sensor kinase